MSRRDISKEIGELADRVHKLERLLQLQSPGSWEIIELQDGSYEAFRTDDVYAGTIQGPTVDGIVDKIIKAAERKPRIKWCRELP